MLLTDASRFGASALRFGAEVAASTPKRSLVSKTARTTSPDTENPGFGWPRGPYNTRAGYAALLCSLVSQRRDAAGTRRFLTPERKEKATGTESKLSTLAELNRLCSIVV